MLVKPLVVELVEGSLSASGLVSASAWLSLSRALSLMHFWINRVGI